MNWAKIYVDILKNTIESFPLILFATSNEDKILRNFYF